MGIKHFFSWFKNRFNSSLQELKKNQTFSDESISVSVDNFMIDMNGLFHESAQKVYKYGNYQPPPTLLGKKKIVPNTLQKQLEVFKDVCETIIHLVNIVQPKKHLILCVDGPAPLSKQVQQRQRRFISSMEAEKNPCGFNSNAITPGTKFMDNLSKYIDWFIRKNLSENPSWAHLEVIFSNEKSPGEGEHKLINYIRHHGNENETYCIHGMDADLIMLSLGTHVENFYILREDIISEGQFYVINIRTVRTILFELMDWTKPQDPKTEFKTNHRSIKFDPEKAVDDFILMCFTVGNDFLPHLPGIEIIENGIEFMLDTYKNVCQYYGHLTKYTENGIRFSWKTVSIFLGTLAQYEKGVLENKLKHKEDFFHDELLEKHSRVLRDEESGEINHYIDLENYCEDYYTQNFSLLLDKKQLCHDYLEGMQWVLSYYTSGVPSWSWYFPHYYAPFAHDIADHVKSFIFKDYGVTSPTLPFLQLLSVLPLNSADLLPKELSVALTTTLKEFCPTKFKVDLAGKRRSWEGVALLPPVDFFKIKDVYNMNFSKINPLDLRRNKLGHSFIYTRKPETQAKSEKKLFKSFYGDLYSCVDVKIFKL